MQISIREGHVYVLGGKTAIPIRDLNGLIHRARFKCDMFSSKNIP